MQAETFRPMRGLLKKRGGASRGLGVTTWHWRFCVLHKHALAIHSGHDRPHELRSAVPLKHVLQVAPATAEQSGGRSFAFALHTSVGRSWVFCCMSETDLQEWIKALRAVCVLTHGAGLSNALDQQ